MRATKETCSSPSDATLTAAVTGPGPVPAAASASQSTPPLTALPNLQESDYGLAFIQPDTVCSDHPVALQTRVPIRD